MQSYLEPLSVAKILDLIQRWGRAMQWDAGRRGVAWTRGEPTGKWDYSIASLQRAIDAAQDELTRRNLATA